MTEIKERKLFPSRPFNLRARIVNGIMITLCFVSATAAISALFAIFGQVIYEGLAGLGLRSEFMPAFWELTHGQFKLVMEHLGHTSWDGTLIGDFFTRLPGSPDERIGMANCIWGSIELIVLSSLIGVPLGMLCGIYLAEYGRKNLFTTSVRLFVDVLAGIPSIVVGIVAYELVVRRMGNFSGVAGALALAFIMVPIVARTTEEMLRLVPVSQREASVGVGASQFQTLFRVVLPAASAGIITGVMLAIARVAGETAPLMFTALGNDQWVTDPTKPFPSLTLQIFKYATSAEPHWQQLAWSGMLVLVTIILTLNAAVRYVSRKKQTLV